jgi:DHA1 family inner membrane transport protein
MDIRLFWLALGTFAIGTEGFVISSLLPEISADTGVTIAQGGYLVLAFALAYALGAPVLASITGHRDRRLVLTGAALVFAGGNLLAGFSHTYLSLMLARIVMAFAAGLYAATAQATAVAISEPHHRARAISVIVGGTTLAVAFGAPLGALIAGFAGWRGTFLAIAGLAVVASAAIWFLLPAGLKGVRLSLAQRVGVIALPGMLPALLTTIFILAGAFSVFTYIAPLAVHAVGLSAAVLPALLLSFGIGGALGNYAGGQLADRVGATRTVYASVILATATLAFISVIPQLPAGIAGPALIGIMVPWGFVGWAFPPAQASRVMKLAPDAAALALSLNGSAIYLGVALGSVVGGAVLTYGSPADLGWVGAMLGLTALAILTLSRPAPSLAEARLG